MNLTQLDLLDTPLWVGPSYPALTTYAVANFHYSQRLPLAVKKAYSVWEWGEFIGAVVFSIPPGRMVPRYFGLGTNEVVELARVALATHQTNVSRIVAICLKMLRKETEYRLVVSYADPYRGHHGGIYQAGGWVYTGEATKHKGYLGHDGRIYHDRSIKANGYVEHFGKVHKCPTPADMAATIHLPRKHRYAFALDASIAERIKSMARAYPKRVVNADSGMSSIHDGRGGATPTTTLRERIDRLTVKIPIGNTDVREVLTDAEVAELETLIGELWDDAAARCFRGQGLPSVET